MPEVPMIVCRICMGLIDPVLGWKDDEGIWCEEDQTEMIINEYNQLCPTCWHKEENYKKENQDGCSNITL